MISNGEVIRSIIGADDLTEVMLGAEWWNNPKYEVMGWWDKPYPCHRHSIVSVNPLISNGEPITNPMNAETLISVMTGYRFPFDVGNSHRQFYWGYSLISSGEVITDAERMDDLLEVMTGSRFGYGSMDFRKHSYQE